MDLSVETVVEQPGVSSRAKTIQSIDVITTSSNNKNLTPNIRTERQPKHESHGLLELNVGKI